MNNGFFYGSTLKKTKNKSTVISFDIEGDFSYNYSQSK